MTDTIAAIATPPGRGGVGVIRVSGPDAGRISRSLLGDVPKPRFATVSQFKGADGRVIDEGLAIWFAGPASFTGEDVLELHGHGGPVVMDEVLAAVIAQGARVARPGEFSERAFLNNKLDLAQAEAIADLIDSGSTQAARAAMRSLRGEFSAKIHALIQLITELRVYVEAAIDFPEEEVDFLDSTEITTGLDQLFLEFDAIRLAARQGCLLQEGMTVVIAGRPNAGKSSLLNRLAGYDAAIVTDVPGTTRDVLRERIDIDGMPLHVIDTAGLRDQANIVEQEGIRRARVQMDQADRVLLVEDASDATTLHAELMAELPDELPVTVIRNKIDLSGEPAGINKGAPPVIHLSAKTGDGVDDLVGHLKQVMGYQAAGTGTLSARRRHIDALDRARRHVDAARQQLVDHKAGELMAEELRLAQNDLSEITGEFTSDDLLGEIFSSFCIGK